MKGKRRLLTHRLRENVKKERILMGKIKGTKSKRRRIMLLQNIKYWTGITLEKMMIEIGRNGKGLG